MTDPQISNLDMPEMTNTSVDTSVSNSFPTTLPVGHDTVTTTDEEEAAEALLALGNVSNYDKIVQEEDNATLMPIGKASTTVDINPVPLRLSVNDVNIAIQKYARWKQTQTNRKSIYGPNNVPSRRKDHSSPGWRRDRGILIHQRRHQPKRSIKSKNLRIKEA